MIIYLLVILKKIVTSKVLTENAINVANKYLINAKQNDYTFVDYKYDHKSMKMKDKEDDNFMISSDKSSTDVTVPYETKFRVTKIQEKEIIGYAYK